MEHLLKCGLEIEESHVKRFWDHLDKVGHEVAVRSRQLRSLEKQQIWPLGLHGDDANMGIISAPFEKILGMSMNVVLYRPRSTRISRFLLFSLEVKRLVDVRSTLNPILARIVESFNRLTEIGIEGRKFIVTELRGDQAWNRLIFEHESFWKTVNICFRCEATTRPTHLNYALCNGSWLATSKSTEDFLMKELPVDMSRLIVLRAMVNS